MKAPSARARLACIINRRILICGIFGSCGLSFSSPAAAQLITAELFGNVTATAGDLTILSPGIMRGTPLHLTFTFDAHMTPERITGSSASYLATGTRRGATVSVGNFAYSIPEVALRIESNIQYGSADFTGRADLLQYRSLTTTGIEDTEISATLLYPVGTWTSYEPTLPPGEPLYQLFFVERYYPMDPVGRGVHVRSSSVDDSGPLTPVPESSWIAALSAVLLIGIVGRRFKRSSKQDQSHSCRTCSPG
jgi:hypothetical protein